MNRTAFHALFETAGPVILPVIHVLDEDQAATNLQLVLDAGLKGCFLINHDFGVEPFLPIIRSVRARFPDCFMGLNFLAVSGLDAFPVLADLDAAGCRIDAYWADDARIDERVEDQHEADSIAAIRQQSGWKGLYFGGTAFKKQRPVAAEDYGRAARIAAGYMDVVTTSGIATGQAAEHSKIADFRASLADTPIALASGITPENAETYRDIDAFMVATGINYENDFYTIDPARLNRLIAVARSLASW